MNDQRSGISLSLSGNQTAVGLMLGYVVLQSFVPLFVAFGAGDSPFIFNAARGVGMSAGCALILLIVSPRMLFSGEMWNVVRSRALSIAIILSTASSLQLGLYAWSAQFIDISVAAALYETRPIFLVFIMGWLFRTEERYRIINAKTILMFVFAILGMALIISSQAGEIGVFASADTGVANLAMGVALALSASVVATFGVFGFYWSTNIASELSMLSDSREQTKSRLELFSTIIGIAICNLISLPFIASAGFMRNEPLSLDAIMYGAMGGLFIWAVGLVFRHMAILTAVNLEINVMRYLTPALALVWLFAFSQVGEVHLVLLLSGVGVIIAANVGMYLEMLEQPQESAVAQAREPVDIDALIAGGESDTVEFKSTFRKNLKSNKNDEEMQRESLKTIAAFLNSYKGGTLIIGVSDDGSPVGIDKETFRNEDHMRRHISGLARERMRQTVMDDVKLNPVDYKGVRVLAAVCSPSGRPIFCEEGNDEYFYIRSDSSTIALPLSEQHRYTRERFPDWDGA